MNEYPIGTPGQAWTQLEKQQWYEQQKIKRSYASEVLMKLDNLSDDFTVVNYGTLSINPNRYPLFLLHSQFINADKPTVLITGGVHGYETSGVKGALEFTLNYTNRYLNTVNMIIVPCVSPWGYETINRWNPDAIDPNRSFTTESTCEESTRLMKAVSELTLSLGLDIDLHIDLHETTDTDNTEFRPALAARDAIEQSKWHIPDGFYLVGDTPNPQPEFQKAIIDQVKNITHIAPADERGNIIGALTSQSGVINYDKKALYLCAGMTNAKYVSTTEVYPDSPKTSPENCIEAQVTAICAAIDYVKAQ